jgi:hypothetical protein
MNRWEDYSFNHIWKELRASYKHVSFVPVHHHMVEKQTFRIISHKSISKIP